MSAYANTSISPIPETVKHKTDNLNWENMPQEPCELNYPATLTVAWKDNVHVFSLCMLASILFPPGANLLGSLIAERLFNWFWGVGSAMLGTLLFAHHHRDRLRDRKGNLPPLCSWKSCGLLIGPTFVWLSIVLTGRLNEPVGAFLYFGLIAAPMIFVLADLIATHSVHWLTAGLSLDHDALFRWREDWAGRFLEAPAIPMSNDLADEQLATTQEAAGEARQGYFLSVFWLSGALLVPCVVLMALVSEPRRETVGLQILTGATFGLMLAAWIRLHGRWKLIKRLRQCLEHWLHYGNRGPMPPWIFQSPCGSPWFRRFLTILTVGYLSVAIGSLAMGPTLSLISTVTSPPTTVGDLQNADAQPAVAQSTVEILADYTLMQWMLLMVAILVGVFLPMMMLCLGILVVIGPIIHAYAELLPMEGAY